MTTRPAPSQPDELAAPLDLADIRRDTLTNRAGVRYRDFKQSLRPRFGLVWFHILSGHVGLLVITLGMIAAWQRGAPAIAIIAVGACAYGYALAFIVLFIHEAAHYNIARDRALNDSLANLLIGLFIGQSVAGYRASHFDHHRYLGTPADTEHAYFDPLNVRFFAESVTGVKTLKRLANREKGRGLDVVMIAGALINVTLIGIALLTEHWPLAAAWTLGVVIVFPFLAAIRQLLEHRSDLADARVDYSSVAHGPVHRLFGSGPLASTFGGAGFNRHMLHHWEPQISCTRLRELERFLLDTPAAPVFEQRRTSYRQTFLLLLKRGRAH
jgi:fatty acid desaturase